MSNKSVLKSRETPVIKHQKTQDNDYTSPNNGHSTPK